MAKAEPVIHPRRESVRRVQIVLVGEAKAVLVQTWTPVVSTLQEGGVERGGRRDEYEHGCTVADRPDTSPLRRRPDLVATRASETRVIRRLPAHAVCRPAERAPTQRLRGVWNSKRLPDGVKE